MAFTWTYPVSAGSRVTAALINENRTNYKTVEGSVTFSPSYSATVDTVTASSRVVTTMISQIRSAINTLETKMSGNCNCTNCCQTCQVCQVCMSCQYCQVYSGNYCVCQTCEACQGLCAC